jgi:regulator of sigma D
VTSYKYETEHEKLSAFHKSAKKRADEEDNIAKEEERLADIAQELVYYALEEKYKLEASLIYSTINNNAD